jgi:hypothetical protein
MDMFHPGETISHNFIIPFVADEIAKVIVSYKQSDHIIIEKEVTSGFKAESRVEASFSIAFTQQESLLFADKKDYTIQLNVLTNGSSRHASCEIKVKDGGIQHIREVITNG